MNGLDILIVVDVFLGGFGSIRGLPEGSRCDSQ